jgi:hypothetical protein
MTNLSQARPEVKLELGGILRRIHFGLYAFSQLEKLLGKNPITDKVNLNSLNTQIYYVWAGLVENWPELDGEIIDGRPDENVRNGLKQVSKLVTPAKFKDVMESVGTAYKNAIGELVGSDSSEGTQGSAEKKD